MNLRNYVPGALLGLIVGLAVAFGLHAYDHAQRHEAVAAAPAVVPIEPAPARSVIIPPAPHYRFTKIKPVAPHSCAAVGARKKKLRDRRAACWHD
jgi:hypothetical protein